jgi:hypothetical protein
VRRAKVALIERASAFGELDPPRLTVTQMIRVLNAFDRGRLIVPKPIDALAPSLQEPDRSAEAVRRVLPELRKLDRYERRARVLDLSDIINIETIYSCSTNEANFSQFIQWLEKLAPESARQSSLVRAAHARPATSSRSRSVEFIWN